LFIHFVGRNVKKSLSYFCHSRSMSNSPLIRFVPFLKVKKITFIHQFANVTWQSANKLAINE